MHKEDKPHKAAERESGAGAVSTDYTPMTETTPCAALSLTAKCNPISARSTYYYVQPLPALDLWWVSSVDDAVHFDRRRQLSRSKCKNMS